MNYLEVVRKTHPTAILDQIKKGKEISLDVKDFDSPEDYLSPEDLTSLAVYYCFENAVNSEHLKGLSDEEFEKIDDFDKYLKGFDVMQLI